MPSISVEHIELDAAGVARISGTRSRVINLALDVRNGLTPDQMRKSYPHLSPAEIHAGLAYYYDHQTEMDAEIERELFETQQLQDWSKSPVNHGDDLPVI